MARVISGSETTNFRQEQASLDEQTKKRGERLKPLVRKAIEGLSENFDTELANRFDALPIACDYSGCLLLRDTGEVSTLGFVEGARPRVVDDVRPYLGVLTNLQKRYPEISQILRERPVSGVDCSECNGTGKNRWNLKCGPCHSLGWTTNYPLTFCSSGTPRKRGAP